jgi:UDP-glucuronate decarboxylase
LGELAERITKITGSSSPIVFLPELVDAPKERRPDISLASTGVGTAFLSKTIAYFEKLAMHGYGC